MPEKNGSALHRLAPEGSDPPASVDMRTPDLLARYDKGDSRAYDALVRRYEEPLRRYVLAHTSVAFRGHVSVDDLLQETHVHALRGLPGFTYRKELSFFLWLCGIARRRIYRHAERLKHAPPVVSLNTVPGVESRSSTDLLELLVTSRTGPAEEYRLKEQLHLLALGLCDLPERRRESLVLKYFEGLDNATCAARMQLSVGAFKVLAFRATDQLQRRLARLLGERSA